MTCKVSVTTSFYWKIFSDILLDFVDEKGLTNKDTSWLYHQVYISIRIQIKLFQSETGDLDSGVLLCGNGWGGGGGESIL